MAVCIGVDLHVRTQSVCWCDTATGEQQERALDHERDDVRVFYAQFIAPAAVAIAAVARKLVLRLYRMLREEIDYDEFQRRGRDARRAREDTSQQSSG